MPISPTSFRHAYNRFQAIHEQGSGKPLDSFSEQGSLAYEWEDYKKGIPYRALAVNAALSELQALASQPFPIPIP